MKAFFEEFKKFITRGNVVDMSVGVIVGGAFTAIVNGLSNFILKPLINALLALIFGANSLSELYSVLIPSYTTDEAGQQIIDIANSIYIDWGSFINAIINFFLTAIVLFTIVKLFNRVRERNKSIMGELEALANKRVSRAEKKAMISEGFNPKDKESVKTYRDMLVKREAEAKAKADAEAAAAEEAKIKAEEERLARQEQLLTEIRDLLKNK